MYAVGAQKALAHAIADQRDLIASPDGKPLKPQQANALAARVMFELWERGFALSARAASDQGDRDPALHDAWRSSKRGKEVPQL